MPLATAKLDATLANQRIVAVLERFDELVRIGQSGGAHDFRFRCTLQRVANILRDRAVEQRVDQRLHEQRVVDVRRQRETECRRGVLRVGFELRRDVVEGLVVKPGTAFLITACITLVTGTVFLMWLGEQITERGIGNGISMIILASIVAGLPAAIAGTAELVRNGEMSAITAILMLIGGVAAIIFVVYMERAQRRITVNYARRQQGRKMFQAQSTHLPFKINMSGVIPPIFASSILMFPATIAQFFGQAADPNAVQRTLQTIGANLGPGQPVYVLLYAGMIIFFCFFYTALMYNSKDTADNLKKAGAFLPGIRPGAHTAEYIDRVLTRLTFWGAIYIAGVCLLPEIVRMFYPAMPFNFGGTSLLILVVVTMDFMSQLQAHAMSHQYEGMMQKANLRNYGRGGQLR